MFKIIIVEDEEAARAHISAVIRRKFPEFSIIAEVENGKECLEIIRENRPDIIITDIRMPVMDGLSLVENMSEDYPDIKILILSGYEDFEYARQAFTHGVSDYLLKPVNIKKLGIILNKFSSILKNEEQKNILSHFHKLTCLNNRTLPNLIPFSEEHCFRLAILRSGGHVSRFSPPKNPSRDSFNHGIWSINGRDSNESLMICSSGLYNNSQFTERINRLCESDLRYYTLMFYPHVVSVNNFFKAFKILYESIDNNIILGKSRIINGITSSYTKPDRDTSMNNQIDYALTQQNYGALKKIITGEIDKMKKLDSTLIQLETQLKQFIYLIQQQNQIFFNNKESDNIGVELELILSECNNYSELSKLFWDLISRIIGIKEVDSDEVDMPIFFKAVCRYIENNYGSKLQIQHLCKIFNVSESYISKLFRKYLSCTFTAYLRRCRVNAAKKLMNNNPEMMLQSVAQYCGFEDQFYFSKIFKQESGMTPSQFKKNI